MGSVWWQQRCRRPPGGHAEQGVAGQGEPIQMASGPRLQRPRALGGTSAWGRGRRRSSGAGGREATVDTQGRLAWCSKENLGLAVSPGGCDPGGPGGWGHGVRLPQPARRAGTPPGAGALTGGGGPASVQREPGCRRPWSPRGARGAGLGQVRTAPRERRSGRETRRAARVLGRALSRAVAVELSSLQLQISFFLTIQATNVKQEKSL